MVYKNAKTCLLTNGYFSQMTFKEISMLNSGDSLSLRGNVLHEIIKTFTISQTGYELEMDSIPKHREKEINTLILEFLWDRKQPIVNRKNYVLNIG